MKILRARAEGSSDKLKLKEVEPPKILAAWIQETTNTGLVSIKFNQTLVEDTLPKVEEFDESLLTMALEPAEIEENFNATWYEFTWRIESFVKE